MNGLLLFCRTVSCLLLSETGSKQLLVSTQLRAVVRQKTRYSGQPGVKAACQLWQTAIAHAGCLWEAETEVSEWAAPGVFVAFSAFSLPLHKALSHRCMAHTEKGLTGEISITQISCQAVIKNSRSLELMHLMSVLFKQIRDQELWTFRGERTTISFGLH